MDVQRRLDDIVTTLQGARSMPMSASCVVNRTELLAMLDEVREALPGSLEQARELLGGRDRMVAEAQQEAQRIVDSAQGERGALIEGTEIARAAQAEADRILAAAQQEAAEIRAEADDYVDSKLANFEVVLSKTMGSVDRGREKLLGAGPGADAYSEDFAEDAPERTADPAELRQRADAYVDARLGSVSAVLGKTLEAVGRGRQKLLGHRATDELGALGAHDDAAGYPARTSDADYMAGLAEVVPPPPPVPSQFQPPAQPAPVAQDGSYGYPQQYDPQQQYGAQQPQYGVPAQQDVYASADAGYTYQDQAYAPNPQAPQNPQNPQDPYPVTYSAYGTPQPQPQGEPAALDETSLFDTGMIDMEAVRRYEQGR